LDHATTNPCGQTWLTSAAENPLSQLASSFHSFTDLANSINLTDYQQTTGDTVLTVDNRYQASSETEYSGTDTSRECQHLTALEWENLIQEMEVDADADA
jgi:hypothetical protein